MSQERSEKSERPRKIESKYLGARYERKQDPLSDHKNNALLLSETGRLVGIQETKSAQHNNG